MSIRQCYLARKKPERCLMTTKSQENYVDHEVRIRVIEQLAKNINSKLNLMIGLMLGSFIIPVCLHMFGLI